MAEDDKTMLKDLEKQINRVKRAPRSSPAVVSQQRDILKRLIELAASPQSHVKAFVAKYIQLYINDFPELEDDAINAVYDLCEDQDPQVRTDGYRAITEVSRQQKKWVKRNADVLVQLLQSDEPEEVGVVEKQLLEHLDMDPTVTVNVLCDQVVPTEEPVDDEDRAVRDRLRALVLDFMKGPAKRGIVRNATAQRFEPENALVGRVLGAFPRFSSSDLDTLVRDILLSLPSYTSGSRRSSELLQAILVEAEACYKTELGRQSENATLVKTRHLAELASYVAIEKNLTSPAPIFHFWRPNKITKLALQQFSEELQLFVFDSVIGAFTAMEGRDQYRNSQDLSAIRTSVVDAAVLLLPCFVNAQSAQRKPWEACKALLAACDSHKSAGTWVIPPNLRPVLQKAQTQAAEELGQAVEGEKKCLEEVQTLILSLLKSASPGATASSSSRQGMSADSRSKPNGGPVHIKRKFNEGVVENPLRPAASQSMPSESARPREDRPGSRGSRQGQARQDNARNRTPLSIARVIATADAEQSTQSMRRNKLAAEPSVPSLLSRLALSSDIKSPVPAAVPAPHASLASLPAKRASDHADTPPAKRQHTYAPPQSHSQPVVPPGGFSIKGAAQRQSPERDRPASLLNRLGSDAAAGRGKRRTKT